LLRPFLNMSALFLTNMVSDSGANVGPCWNSQLLQRISTNIQESATNKINIITRERERKRERKRKEKTIAPPPLSDGRRVWGWFAARAIGGTAALRLLLVLSCTSWNGTGH
jgi:hypothetical protein